jgi:hypothetical protein
MSSKSAKIVPCSDATATYRVSRILDGKERGDECPKDGGSYMTRYWSVSDKTTRPGERDRSTDGPALVAGNSL